MRFPFTGFTFRSTAPTYQDASPPPLPNKGSQELRDTFVNNPMEALREKWRNAFFLKMDTTKAVTKVYRLLG